MYSLSPTTTHQKSPALSEEKLQEGNPQPDKPRPAKTPQMWFNPTSQRWISTSCRIYREILRDKALVQIGLPPGPSQKVGRKRKLKQTQPRLEENRELVRKTYKVQEKKTSSPQMTTTTSDRELRDAYFKKYGM